MAYLHYTHNTDFLETHFGRTERKALANDARIRHLEEQAGEYRNMFEPIPEDLAFTLAECRKRRHSLSTHLDMIAEELDWREDRVAMIAAYANFGYELRFRCGLGEFDTEAEALDEARFLFAHNELLLDMGPDGAGCDDMLPPGRMVQAVFVKSSIDWRPQ